MTGPPRPPPAETGPAGRERRVLQLALALNAAMFAVETAGGILGRSSGLMADGLDMLSDASAYAIALVAISRDARFKAFAATLSGALLMVLGVALLVDVARRAVWGEPPEGWLMVAVATVALVVNVVVLRLLRDYRGGEVHLRATWIFTRADVVANAAVILSGAAVLLTGARVLDLVVGAGIGAYVLKEAVEILREAGEARRRA